MRNLIHEIMLMSAIGLSACATSSSGAASKITGSKTASSSDVYIVNSGGLNTKSFDDFKITAAEAKTHACPESVLEVGASDADCQCAEEKLFEIGQDGAALAELEAGMTELSGDALLTGIQPPRVTAIEVIRIDAFDACGFFEEGHPVGEGL